MQRLTTMDWTLGCRMASLLDTLTPLLHEIPWKSWLAFPSKQWANFDLLALRIYPHSLFLYRKAPVYIVQNHAIANTINSSAEKYTLVAVNYQKFCPYVCILVGVLIPFDF
ncbi:hypothetical protein PM082_023374, partial [Marasmius tenuissimus]